MSSTTAYSGVLGYLPRSRRISSLMAWACTGLPPGLLMRRMTPSGVLVLEGVLQSCGDAVGARQRIGLDHAVQFHHRGVLAGVHALASADPAQRDEQDREQIEEREALEEDAPAARLALLGKRGFRELADDVALPVLAARRGCLNLLIIRHGNSSSSERNTLPSRSKTGSFFSRLPLQGPRTQRPVSGR